MTLAYVGLGANIGDTRAQVLLALDELDRLPQTRVTGRSSLYRSAPLGNPDQPEFVNAVAQLETGLSAACLLDSLMQMERRHGRERSFRNAPRTLDLDLLLYGEERIETPALSVPHPRMHERAFVLRPLLEIDPEVSVPGKGKARTLLESCKSQTAEKSA